MSWGALPYWIYEVMHQHDLALMQCAFPEEWQAGLSKHAEKHMYRLHPSVFATHDAGGWNNWNYLEDYADVKSLR